MGTDRNNCRISTLQSMAGVIRAFYFHARNVSFVDCFSLHVDSSFSQNCFLNVQLTLAIAIVFAKLPLLFSLPTNLSNSIEMKSS